MPLAGGFLFGSLLLSRLTGVLKGRQSDISAVFVSSVYAMWCKRDEVAIQVVAAEHSRLR